MPTRRMRSRPSGASGHFACFEARVRRNGEVDPRGLFIRPPWADIANVTQPPQILGINPSCEIGHFSTAVPGDGGGALGRYDLLLPDHFPGGLAPPLHAPRHPFGHPGSSLHADVRCPFDLHSRWLRSPPPLQLPRRGELHASLEPRAELRREDSRGQSRERFQGESSPSLREPVVQTRLGYPALAGESPDASGAPRGGMNEPCETATVRNFGVVSSGSFHSGAL